MNTYRCQCPKPNVITRPVNRYNSSKGRKIIGILGIDILYFKKATRFCKQCGIPICGKCMKSINWLVDNQLRIKTGLCYSCAYILQRNLHDQNH